MNSPLEIMNAIVDNGGPVEAWVRQLGEPWFQGMVCGVLIDANGFPRMICTEDAIWDECSLTDPHANYVPIPDEWTHGWASWRAVDKTGVLHEYSKSKPIRTDDGWINGGSVRPISKGHDPTSWQDSLEERIRPIHELKPGQVAMDISTLRYLVRVAEESMFNISEHFDRSVAVSDAKNAIAEAARLEHEQ